MNETSCSFYFLTILCGENIVIDKQACREHSKGIALPSILSV
jgi:hypothetical protein